MRVPRFFCAELSASATTLILPDAVHRHAVQVLRLKPNDPLTLFDGNGLEREARITEIDKRASSVSLGEIVASNNESPLKVTLLQGISRGERMDYAIQKAVELGVSRIVPVVTSRCNVQLSGDRAEKRWRHWQGVLTAACEQSGRSYLPQLEDVIHFEEALQQCRLDCKLVLDPEAQAGIAAVSAPNEVALLIGPEGGLSDEEISLANQQGFQSVQFGPRILRTETASAAAIAVVQALWGDLS